MITTPIGALTFRTMSKYPAMELTAVSLSQQQFPVLRSVAAIVFGMVTSIASSERNFSTTGFIHWKLSNSLVLQTVMKLEHIKTTTTQLGYGSYTNENSDYNDDDEEIFPIDDEE